MSSDMPLDYAVFQLSPRRSRCELFISYDGTTEKLASGSVKPFVTHLKATEEQFASSVKTIKLDAKRYNDSESWFTKGTFERFVKYVYTPEVLEVVNTFDAEMSQLEAAQKIYSQGPVEGYGSDGGATTASDATKKELLRAIDLRLTAVGQDLSAACIHASDAGFNPVTVLELQHFAGQFGAHRLSESCSKFMSLCQRRPELFNTQIYRVKDEAIRSSYGSDMSLDDQVNDLQTGSLLNQMHTSQPDELKSSPLQQPNKPSSIFSLSSEKEDIRGSGDKHKEKKEDTSLDVADSVSPSIEVGRPARRLSVQDRISLFENKQKESSSGSGSKSVVGKSVEHRRLSSDVSSAGQMGPEKAVLRRWSGASDMSIESSGERKDLDSSVVTPTSLTKISTPTSSEDMDTNDLGNSGTQSKPETTGVGHENQSNSKELFENEPDKTRSGAQTMIMPGASQEASHSMSRLFSGGSESDRLKDASNAVKQFNASDSESTIVSSVSAVSEKNGNKVDQVITQHRPRSLGQGNVVTKKEYESAEQQPEISSTDLEDSDAHRMKFQRRVSTSVQTKKPKGRRDDSGSGLVTPGFARKNTGDIDEIYSSISNSSLEQAQQVKQSKGNQELHDELKLKADELEKLFAVHKLRIPGNQSSGIDRSKSVEALEQKASLVSRQSSVEASTPQSASTKVVQKSNSCNIEKLTTASPSIQAFANQDFDKTPKQNLYSLGSSDDSRGKLYDKYMQKRDAKLKEEWSSNKAEKEARMKAMEDSFERSRSEMKFKFAGSADKLSSQHRAEKLKSVSARYAVRREQPIHSFVNDDDEEQAEFGQGSLTSETYLAGGSSKKSVQNKKAFSNNTVISSTPRTTGVPAPRLSAKASGSSIGRRKQQPENPLAQSVPNFSDLRKENTKPSTASNKGAARSQVRNYTRSKSSNDDVLSFEEKSRRPHHMRKSSANPLELKDLTSLNFEDDEHEDELSRRAEVFLRKGNTSSIPRLRSSIAAKTFENEGEELMYTTKEEEDLDSVVDEDNGDPSGSQESVKSTNSGHENGVAVRVPSEANPDSISETAAVLPSAFHSMASVLDSPGESPGSWHSRVHNPYSFQHDISDFDGTVESPVGIPAYWNTNESDAARMRKKWGAAQKPIIDSSHGQSRKENKGLKRFLNFGRKNRGPDSLADWGSATTSDGDDDTDDGKDLAKWPSDDLRKSRMGFLHYQPDDGFSEADSGSEKVPGFPSSIPTPPMNFKLKEDQLSGSALKAPKSFFSLSTFRSKGSESKPR